MNNSELLSKSTQILNKADFICQYELYEKYEWLLNKGEGLESLWRFLQTDERELMKELFVFFHVMNSDEISRKVHDIAVKIVDEWKCDYRKTKIVAACN